MKSPLKPLTKSKLLTSASTPLEGKNAELFASYSSSVSTVLPHSPQILIFLPNVADVAFNVPSLTQVCPTSSQSAQTSANDDAFSETTASFALNVTSIFVAKCSFVSNAIV